MGRYDPSKDGRKGVDPSIRDRDLNSILGRKRWRSETLNLVYYNERPEVKGPDIFPLLLKVKYTNRTPNFSRTHSVIAPLILDPLNNFYYIEEQTPTYLVTKTKILKYLFVLQFYFQRL